MMKDYAELLCQCHDLIEELTQTLDMLPDEAVMAIEEAREAVWRAMDACGLIAGEGGYES
jgi:hypothetical protein